MSKKSNVVALMDKDKEAEVMYQKQCQQQYEDFLVDAAYADQEKRRKEGTGLPEFQKAYIKYREWYSLTANATNLTAVQNRIETMGFPVVATVAGSMGEYIVSGCRVVSQEISEKVVDTEVAEPLPDVDPATEPAALGVADENARREWENSNE